MPRVLSTLGETWRSWLPAALRDSPDHLAVITAVARETERVEAAIETVRAQFFVQTADVLLGVHEAMFGLQVAPAGQTLAQRRDAVIAARRKRRSAPFGTAWQEKVTALVGPSWSYEEHDPADVTSPPDSTIRITLPFPPSSGLYARTERFIRDITPAHLDLIVTFAGGFVLDESQLDQEELR